MTRDDHAAAEADLAVVDKRLAEHHAARHYGRRAGLDAAETNDISALNTLLRNDETLLRSRALIARLGDEESGSAAYVWSSHVTALVGLGQHAEVRAGARRCWAMLGAAAAPSTPAPSQLVGLDAGGPGAP